MSGMERCLALAEKGHNVIVTGQRGTGKIYLLMKIIQHLSLYKKVAVTATTGMASLQLGLAATTLHHWAGIFDGRFTHEELKELLANDDKFANAKRRIFETECLIVDEVSMLSCKIFNMVEFVCRQVKQKNQVFGGIQVIASGDFKQLPPVPNRRLDDDGKYCFESEIFTKALTHHVNLTQVMRQQEEDLINAINELCDGCPSDETMQLLKTLDRPLNVPDGTNITRLYGANFDASFVNQTMLEEMEGELHVYKAQDEGDVKLFRGNASAVPKTLVLKQGAPVILVKNIGNGLFNGMRGKVNHFSELNLPVINFDGKLLTLSPARFEIYDLQQQKVLATRSQIPVILAFALTVHRAQGQTIQFVEVDCASFFAPGQMGVAIGRATNKEGLCVTNVNRNAVHLKHPQCVYDFYTNVSVEPLDDYSCCRSAVKIPDDEIQPSCSQHHCSDEEMTEHIADVDIVAEDLPQLDSPWTVQEFIDASESAEFMSCISREIMETDNHMRFLYSKVHDITNKNLNTPQHWADAYGELDKFIISELHINSTRTLFGVDII